MRKCGIETLKKPTSTDYADYAERHSRKDSLPRFSGAKAYSLGWSEALRAEP